MQNVAFSPYLIRRMHYTVAPYQMVTLISNNAIRFCVACHMQLRIQEKNEKTCENSLFEIQSLFFYVNYVLYY